MAGKLKGLMMPTTPSGCLTEYTSTPVDTFSEYSPFSRCGMPVAKSTTSSPRAISPAASESTLPCSEVRISASSLLRAFKSSRNVKITDWRLASEASRQAGNAAAAADTAASTSATLASRTSFETVPLAGSYTDDVRVDSPSTSLPPMKWLR
jgi:hypothetical protein